MSGGFGSGVLSRSALAILRATARYWPAAAAVGRKAPHSPYDRVDGCRLRHRNPTGAAAWTLFSRRVLLWRPGEFRDRPAACPRGRTREFPWFDRSGLSAIGGVRGGTHLVTKSAGVHSFRELLLLGIEIPTLFVEWIVCGKYPFYSIFDSTGRSSPTSTVSITTFGFDLGKPQLCTQALSWTHHDFQRRGQFRTT